MVQDLSDSTRYLMVEMPHYARGGDILACVVPTPHGGSPSLMDRNARRMRTLYVEVPTAPPKVLYVRYFESSDGIPKLDTGLDRITKGQITDKYPLLGVPIILPESAELLPPSRGFFNFHLIWMIAIPIAAYAGAAYLTFYLTGNKKAEKGSFPWPTLAAWLLNGFSMIVATMLIYSRYRKSILFREVLFHCVLCFLATWLYVFLDFNLGTPLLNKICECIFKHVEYNTPNPPNVKPSATIAINLWSFLIAPVFEEIWKYLLVRFVAFRGIVVDANGLLALGLISGAGFAFYENVVYMRRSPTTAMWCRWFPVLIHTCCLAISCARLAQWRFLGRRYGMFRMIWPAIFIHFLHNALWSFSDLLHYFTNTNLQWYQYDLYVYIGLAVLMFCWVRTEILRTDVIPGVDVHALIESGQISPRSILNIFSDMMCCCSRRRKGLFTSARQQQRPYVFEEDAKRICNAEDVQKIMSDEDVTIPDGYRLYKPASNYQSTSVGNSDTSVASSHHSSDTSHFGVRYNQNVYINKEKPRFSYDDSASTAAPSSQYSYSSPIQQQQSSRANDSRSGYYYQQTRDGGVSTVPSTTRNDQPGRPVIINQRPPTAIPPRSKNYYSRSP